MTSWGGPRKFWARFCRQRRHYNEELASVKQATSCLLSIKRRASGGFQTYPRKHTPTAADFLGQK
jgi:hypothetical protein